MIRLVKTNLRDVPVAADRVERRVSVFAVVPLAEVTAPEVRDEVRELALSLLGAKPATEDTLVIVQPGSTVDSRDILVREVELGSLFEVDEVPFQVRDAPLKGEGMLVLAVSAKVSVPELFQLGE